MTAVNPSPPSNGHWVRPMQENVNDLKVFKLKQSYCDLDNTVCNSA